MKQLVLIFSLILFSFSGRSQMICESLLKDAQTAFDAGNYDGVISMLESGLTQCNFSNGEKERAIIMMIYSQIQKDNPEATDKLVYRLLKLNPNYVVPDPEVVSVYNSAIRKYQVSPSFLIGIQGGFNYPFAHIQKEYSILEGADYGKPYTPQIGIVGGLHLEWIFFGGLSINADPTYSRSTYSRDIPTEQSWNLKYSETSVNYDITGMLKYSVDLKSIRIFVAGGYQYLRLDKSFADLEINGVSGSSQNGYPSYQLAVNKVDMIKSDLRRRDFGSLAIGAGTAIQTDNFVFSLEARFTFNGKNIVNSEKRYANSQLVLDYFYVDNDFDIRRTELRAGISYILGHKIKLRKTR
ncbi:MAG: hypothetical protein U0073_11190 [Bacteroidia bacterium]